MSETVTFKGTPITLSGSLPAVGSAAPDFALVASDLSNKTLADYVGKYKAIVFNIIPSLDTPVCSLSAQRFNKEALTLGDTLHILNVSADLPFAADRFCECHSLKNVENLSTYRCGCFGKNWGARINSGPLEGLMCRAVVVVDGKGTVVYSERVSEIANAPNFDAALEAIKKLL